MTESEASRRLVILALSVDHRTAINDEDCEALNMGFEALEKQMLKKPFIKEAPYIRDLPGSIMTYTAQCPVCHVTLGSSSNRSMLYICGENQHYCRNCGQKLDWSDEE